MSPDLGALSAHLVCSVQQDDNVNIGTITLGSHPPESSDTGRKFSRGGALNQLLRNQERERTLALPHPMITKRERESSTLRRVYPEYSTLIVGGMLRSFRGEKLCNTADACKQTNADKLVCVGAPIEERASTSREQLDIRNPAVLCYFRPMGLSLERAFELSGFRAKSPRSVCKI